MAASKSKERSPSFPFISLKDAVKRLEAFESTFSRHPAPATKAGLAWGMKENSSQAFQTLAALKSFGLLKYQGSAKDRMALLTEDARTYLRAQQGSVKAEVLRRAALKPTQIQKFWNVWGADRPLDAICLDELVLKHGFTDNAARTFLSVYDETIAHAGLFDSDTVTNDVDDHLEENTDLSDGNDLQFKIGDMVNWESDGQLQWKQARKIVQIDEAEGGKRFYKVVGASPDKTGWIPVEQAVRHEGGSSKLSFTPPPADTVMEVTGGLRRAVFPIGDEEVTLIFPAGMTTEAFDELDQYMQIFLKKEKSQSAQDKFNKIEEALERRRKGIIQRNKMYENATPEEMEEWGDDTGE